MNPYASLAQLTVFGGPATALGTLTAAQQQSALDSAAGDIDSAIRGRYGDANVPLVAPIDPFFTEVCCKIAFFKLMVLRGLNPASADYQAFRDGYLDAMGMLGEVQREARHPKVVLASGNLGIAMQPVVISSSVVDMATGATAPQRGW